MIQLAQKLLLSLFISLGQVQHKHTRQKVSPEKSIIGKLFVGVEEEDFFPILSFYLVCRHVDVGPGVLAEKSTGRFLLFADEKINQKTFANLLRSYKSDDIEIGVAIIMSQMIDEVAIHLQFVVATENVKD